MHPSHYLVHYLQLAKSGNCRGILRFNNGKILVVGILFSRVMTVNISEIYYISIATIMFECNAFYAGFPCNNMLGLS